MIILRFGHENIFTIILPLPLILKEEQLSVSDEKIYTVYTGKLSPGEGLHRNSVVRMRFDSSDMTSAVYLGRLKANNQTKLLSFSFEPAG